MNLPPPEKDNLQYYKWIDDIYKEIRYVYLKTNEHHINVLKILDIFLEKFRQYIQRKHGYSTRINDYHLVRETNRLMFLIRDLFCERNDQHYLMKTSEILGGCTFLWLRYHSLDDQEFNETHIEKILNCYALHLQSTTDESFLLKIITHALYVCKKLPRIFYKFIEMHLKRRVQRQGPRNLEAKEDQLYILYIIAFKLWDCLQHEGKDKINIAQYANSYMKPMNSLLSNLRYIHNLPKITSEDVKCGRATKIVIKDLLPSKLLELAEAVVKEDWLKGSDINAPITVDLSIDDDVNRSEQTLENDGKFISAKIEKRNLLDKKQRNLSTELWWVKVLQKRARQMMHASQKESYRIVEVIDLDDEDVHNCDSTSKTNVGMDVQNQSKATQSKEVNNAKKAGQKKISSEENVQINRQEPQKNKRANSNSGENIFRRSRKTQEKNNNCAAIRVKKHMLENSQMRDKVNSCKKFIGFTENEFNVDKKLPQVEVAKTKRQNTQESRNEFKTIEEKTESHPKKIISIDKSQMVSKKNIMEQDGQIVHVESMETDSIFTSDMSGSQDLQFEKPQSKQPRMVKIDHRKSVLKEKPISYHGTRFEFESNDTAMEVTSKKGSRSEENSGLKSVSKDLSKLRMQSKEKARVKISRPTKNITQMVKGTIEFAEDISEDDEVTSIMCTGESKSKSIIVISESDSSESGFCINTKDKKEYCRKNLKSFDGNDKHISDRPIDSVHEKRIHLIDAALNSSVESLQINYRPDDETAVDDTISISSIVEESENYDNTDPKIDDIHVEKINSVENVKASKHKKNISDGSVLFSVSTNRKLSPPRKVEEYKEIFKEKAPQKDRVVFSTSTASAKIRSVSPNYTFKPTPDLDDDKIKSPPLESFSKSDTEFKQMFNNKNYLITHPYEKELTTENNRQTEDKNEHTVENFISKKTNLVTKRSILTKAEGNIQNKNLSTYNVKRKDVSFATVTQDKGPLVLNRTENLDSTVIERKTYDSPLTIQNEPQNWRSSINNSPTLSNQQDRTSQEQDQEIELLSTSDVNSPGSSTTPSMKESGMTQFENGTVFIDDAVGNNTEVVPNKSCESDNNLVSATDSSISSNTLKVKTDLMSSDSELNNADEDSINTIWQLIKEHCYNKPDEKQNSLPLKKRRKLSRDGNSFVEVNCKESSDKKSYDYYDKQIAYPAERCMSILQFLDISQCQTTFFVNNNSSIAIINNSPSQQTILTGGNGFNVIAQQQKITSTTTNTNVYPNIPVQRNVSEEIAATENMGNENVFQCNQPTNKQNNFDYIINTDGSYNARNMGNSSVETQTELIGNNLNYESQNRIEIQKNERPNSPLNYQGRDISENKGPNLNLAKELASIEEGQKLAKQQLLGVNMDHYNLKYEHISNYFHNNQNNFAKKRALLHNDEEHTFWNKSDHESKKYLSDSTKKQSKLKKKYKESRGKPKKSKNNLTDRITRSSNRTLPVNYKDDGLAEGKSRKRKRNIVEDNETRPRADSGAIRSVGKV